MVFEIRINDDLPWHWAPLRLHKKNDDQNRSGGEGWQEQIAHIGILY